MTTPFLSTAAAALLALACTGLASAAPAAVNAPAQDSKPAVAADSPERDRPMNVVVFLVDDMGWADWTGGGSTYYETPNLDRLAKSGMTFSDAYAACPVCSPSRAALLTGRYPQRYGITDYINGTGNNGPNQPQNWKRDTLLLPAPYDDKLPLEEKTLAEYLKDAGYSTFFAGKWHLGPEGYWPQNQGFDVNIGGWDQGGPYRGKQYFSPYDNPQMENGPDGEHMPDRLSTETSDFIKAHKDEPFLTYLSFYSVHTPLMAPDELVEKYRDKRQEMRLTAEGEFGDKLENGRKVRVKQRHAVYAGMIESMDKAVGKVLDTLEAEGLADNTIVIFTSDNGGLSTSEGSPTSNEPMRTGKGWMYEGGVRVPMIVRLPGVTEAGSQSDTVVSGIDVVPTVMGALGMKDKLVDEIDGVDIGPALAGEDLDRGPVFWQYPHYGNQGGAPGASVRDGDWKLVYWYEGDRYELYNLADDVSETNDQTLSESAVFDRLKNELDTWLKNVKARDPVERD